MVNSRSNKFKNSTRSTQTNYFGVFMYSTVVDCSTFKKSIIVVLGLLARYKSGNLVSDKCLDEHKTIFPPLSYMEVDLLLIHLLSATDT